MRLPGGDRDPRTNMLAFTQGLLEADEVLVGFLDSKQSALPCAEAEENDGEEYKSIQPTAVSVQQPNKRRKNQYGSAKSDHCTSLRGADNIFLHE